MIFKRIRSLVLPAWVACFAVASEAKASTHDTASAEKIVRAFLEEVRSGHHPEATSRYLASSVKAHQIQSENEETVIRTPSDYTNHVRDFISLFGHYSFRIDVLIAQKNLVFVRWRQIGHHLKSLNGEQPTGRELLELTSAVYRVHDNKIVKYWLQTDRKGMEAQISAKD